MEDYGANMLRSECGVKEEYCLMALCSLCLPRNRLGIKLLCNYILLVGWWFLFIMIFIAIAATLLIINALFLIGSLLYTFLTNAKGDITPRISISPSVLSCQHNPRLSLQPQVTLYDALVRLSGGSPPDPQNFERSPTEQAAKQE